VRLITVAKESSSRPGAVVRNFSSLAPSQGQNHSNNRDLLIVKINVGPTKPRHSLFVMESVQQGFRVVRQPAMVQRRITVDAGRGLEKLGHALEYLTDEFVHEGCAFDRDHGRLEAIQLLASLNRQIYFQCGVEPSFRERVQSVFRKFLN